MKNLKLENCGQAKPNHKGGCYIRFSEGKIFHSEPRNDAVIDYDRNGKIIGVEFYEGLGKKKLKPKA